ncbi:MAG: IS701-like element ISBj6 family transposase [Acidimicrobiales bacterium]
MNRTFTPTLPTGVLPRLEAYAGLFRGDFPLARQADWSLIYLRGLLQDGERKSIEPLVGRVDLPAQLRVKNPDQCLQNFVNQADWDEQAVWRRYRGHMADTFADPEAVFVIDDTTFPKQGKHSVGVQRQHCGALGKKANCQCAVSIHYAAPKGHCPLAMQLYLPESWLGDAERLDKAGVPPSSRQFKTKGQIALQLLDQVRAEGLPGRVVVADAGYGVSKSFRDGLSQRGLCYVVGVTEEMVVFSEEPRWDAPRPSRGGRPQTRPRLAEASPRPSSLKDLASTLPREEMTWRRGTKGDLKGKFSWTRVWSAQGWATGDCAGDDPLWLLIEEQADGTIKYAYSNLPADTAKGRGVLLWRSRWPVEQGYQQMKEELGLDHFEGRSWRGFHHHACLVMLAFGFLALERLRIGPIPATPGKKGVPRR